MLGQRLGLQELEALPRVVAVDFLHVELAHERDDLLRDDLAGHLSHGEQRYLEICLALATEPRLLLLDEPTAGMTPGETKDATTLIREIVRARGLTLLLIEHDMSVVMGISDRVAVLHFGEKIAEGPPDAIRADPKVIDAYLGGVDD